MESSTNSLPILGNGILVELSTGHSHPPLSLLVCEYLPPNQVDLNVSELTLETEDKKPEFVPVTTLQYRVPNFSVDELKPKCLEHIEAISSWENIIGDDESLYWKLLRAICRFQEADPRSKEVRTHMFRYSEPGAYGETE